MGLDAVDEPTRAQLNLIWHRLDAWPDVTEGLRRLRQRFLIAPCSNGNVSLMVDLARHQHRRQSLELSGIRDPQHRPSTQLVHARADGLGIGLVEADERLGAGDPRPLRDDIGDATQGIATTDFDAACSRGSRACWRRR